MAKSNLNFSLFLTLCCRMTLELLCGLLLLYIKTLLNNGKKACWQWSFMCNIYILYIEETIQYHRWFPDLHPLLCINWYLTRYSQKVITRTVYLLKGLNQALWKDIDMVHRIMVSSRCVPGLEYVGLAHL